MARLAARSRRPVSNKRAKLPWKGLRLIPLQRSVPKDRTAPPRLRLIQATLAAFHGTIAHLGVVWAARTSADTSTMQRQPRRAGTRTSLAKRPTVFLHRCTVPTNPEDRTTMATIDGRMVYLPHARRALSRVDPANRRGQ